MIRNIVKCLKCIGSEPLTQYIPEYYPVYLKLNNSKRIGRVSRLYSIEGSTVCLVLNLAYCLSFYNFSSDVTATNIVPGNLIKLNFPYKDERYAIAALYAPNNKDIPYFRTLFEMENDPNIKHTIYTGDWNISLSQQLDTHGYLHENNTQNIDFVRAKMTEHELTDIWRSRNPYEINYTFMKKTST